MEHGILLNSVTRFSSPVLVAIFLSLIPYSIAGSGTEPIPAAPATEPILSQPAVSWRTVYMRVTAYCPCQKCCGKHSDGVTASGHKIVDGDTFVAADKKYSFGTQMIVPGYNGSKPVEVLDRGGAIRGNRLDVFFNSHEQAKQWGVRYLPVEVQEE